MAHPAFGAAALCREDSVVSFSADLFGLGDCNNDPPVTGTFARVIESSDRNHFHIPSATLILDEVVTAVCGGPAKVPGVLCGDCTGKVWIWEQGMSAEMLMQLPGDICSLAWSSDRTIAAAIGQPLSGFRIFVFPAHFKAQVLTSEPVPGVVLDLTWGRSQLVAALGLCGARGWNWDRESCKLSVLWEVEEQVWSVASCLSDLTAIGGLGCLVLWKQQHQVSRHATDVHAVVFVKSSLLATAHEGTVQLWAVDAQGVLERYATLHGVSGAISSLVACPAGAHVAVCSEGTVVVWDWRSGEVIHAVEPTGRSTVQLAWGGPTTIVARREGEAALRAWVNVGTSTLCGFQQLDTGRMRCGAVSAQTAIVGYCEGLRFSCWDIDSGVTLRQEKATVVACTVCGELIAGVNTEGSVLWFTSSSAGVLEAEMLGGDAWSCHAMAGSIAIGFQSRGGIAVLPLDPVPIVTEVQHLPLPSGVRGDAHDVELSPDARWLSVWVFEDSSGLPPRMLIWHRLDDNSWKYMSSRSVRRKISPMKWLQGFGPLCVAFADGNEIGSPVVSMWCVDKSGTGGTMTLPHDYPVTALAVTPVGSLVTGDERGYVNVFQAPVYERFAHLHAHRGRIVSLCCPDEARMITLGGSAATFKTWRLASREEDVCVDYDSDSGAFVECNNELIALNWRQADDC